MAPKVRAAIEDFEDDTKKLPDEVEHENYKLAIVRLGGSPVMADSFNMLRCSNFDDS
jgi:hypothetical protein